MRMPERLRRPARIGLFAAAVLTAGILAGCAGAAQSTPRPAPTPTPYVFPTPWPPFSAPPTADQVYLALLADRFEIVPHTASSGANGRDPIKRIDATWAGWPLAIGQYKSADTLKAATKWKAGAKPKPGEPAVAFIGQNVLVEWGPPIGPTLTGLTDAQLKSAQTLRDALEHLLGPLTDRTIVPVAASAPSPSTSQRPSPEASARK